MRQLLAALGLLVSFTAAAHDGYPDDCCDGKDCLVVPCGDIQQLGPQHWQHGKVTFGPGQVRKPIDERCHVCEWGTIGRCIFFPVPSTS